MSIEFTAQISNTQIFSIFFKYKITVMNANFWLTCKYDYST